MDQSDARGESLIFKVAVPSVDPPYTNPALTANLVFRVALGIMANVVCLVPLRLLHRGGELAAVVFIVNMELKNIETVVFALIWRNDDMDSWWAGYGVCDVHPYFNNFVMTLYGTCLLAIMRNLSRQVGLMRAQGLTRGEKRRRNLVQALIMFPLPILQVALTWFLTNGRYAIGTLVGCTWIPGASWIYLVFIILPPMIVSAFTVFYAVLTYIRFRQTSIGNDATLSRNRLVNHRAQRARRRLYQTIVSILAPYFPIVLAIGIINIMDTGTMTAYDYQAMHDRQIPFPWSTILYFPSAAIGFGSMNIAYISILTSIPVFIFFGMTKEALNSYRSVLVRCGLGVCFPTLYREYDPDRSLRYAGFSGNSNSSNSHASNSLSTVTQQRSFFKLNTMSVTRTLGSLSSASGDHDLEIDNSQSSHRLTTPLQAKMNTSTTHLNSTSLFRTRLNMGPMWTKLLGSSSRSSPSQKLLPVSATTTITTTTTTKAAAAAAEEEEEAAATVPEPEVRHGESSIDTRIWSDELQPSRTEEVSPSSSPQRQHILQLHKPSGDDDCDCEIGSVHVETSLTRQIYQTRRGFP